MRDDADARVLVGGPVTRGVMVFDLQLISPKMGFSAKCGEPPSCERRLL